MFLCADVLVNISGGVSRVSRNMEAKDVEGELEASFSIEDSKQNFVLGRCQVGYDMDMGFYFVSPFVFFGGAYSLSEYFGHHMNVGLGAEVGMKRKSFAVYIGGGVMFSNISSRKFDIKSIKEASGSRSPKDGDPTFFESSEPSKPWVTQPFVTACLKYQAKKNINITLRYFMQFGGFKQNVTDDYFTQGALWSGVKFEIDPSFTFSAHTVLVGVEYIWGGV